MKDLRIVASFERPDGLSATATMAEPQDSAEFLGRLKGGIVGWLTPLASARHALFIEAPVKSRDEKWREMLSQVCTAWNADTQLRSLNVHVHLILSNRGETWTGCTNAEDPWNQASIGCEMHVFDYEADFRGRQAAQDAEEEAERARRAANPVVSPVVLPRNIRQKLASYLRLEFGESWWSRGSLKAASLTFVGEVTVNGVPTQFWKYPSSSARGFDWATVERFEDHYALGTVSEPPEGLLHGA